MNEVTMELYLYDTLRLKAEGYDLQKEQIEKLKEENKKLKLDNEILTKELERRKPKIKDTPDILLCTETTIEELNDIFNRQSRD